MGCTNAKAASKAPTPTTAKTEASPLPHAVAPKTKGLDYLLNAVCVMLIRAGNLENKDVVGNSDPYAVVRMGSQEYHTRVVHGDLHPVFNERFSFLVPLAPFLPMCNITLLDHDRTTVAEKLGRLRYTLSAAADWGEASQSHWLSLDGARSGQAKIRCFASTRVCMSLRVGEDEPQHVFVPCFANRGPVPKGSLSCKSTDGSILGTVVLPMSKLFTNRTKKKTYNLDFTVASAPLSLNVAPGPILVARAIAEEAENPDVCVEVGSIVLPASVGSVAASSGRLSVQVSFTLAAKVVEAFQGAFDGISSVASAGVASTGAGAPATAAGTSVDASTLRTRSVGSAGIPGVASAGTPRSTTSMRAGQAGVGIGLSMLQVVSTLAGNAAALLQEMNASMDFLLEAGPHPASPFVSPARRTIRRGSTLATTGGAASSPSSTGADSQLDAAGLRFPQYEYPPGAVVESLSGLLEGKACAECGASSPTWAILSAGYFTCSACAHVYRGVNPDNVKSVMDPAWSPSQTASLADASADSPVLVSPDAPWAERVAHIASKRGFLPAKVVADPTPLPKVAGQVYVIVLRARDLENKDPFGYSDPRVIVELGSTVRKTRTIENTTNPRFNENLLAFPWDGNSLLHVRVFDRDTFAPAQGGVAHVSLHGIPPAVEQEVMVPLAGALSGTVTLQVTLQPAPATRT